MKRTVISMGLVVLAFLATFASTRPAAASSWDWEAGMYLWALGMDGQTTVRGQEGNVDLGFTDILEVLDMALAVHLEAGKQEGNLGWFLDVFWSNLGQDLDRPLGDFDMDMAFLEGAVAYNMDDNFQLFGGLRYTTMDLTLTFDFEPPGPGVVPLPDRVKGDQSWTDLMVGGRVGKDIGEKWAFWSRIDLAGFGISDSSNFTLNFAAMGRYRFARAWSFVFGYRWYDVDYEDEKEAFALDVRMAGPVVAASYSF